MCCNSAATGIIERVVRTGNEKFLDQGGGREVDDASLQLAHSSITDTTRRDERNLNETPNGVRNWCSCKRGATDTPSGNSH